MGGSALAIKAKSIIETVDSVRKFPNEKLKKAIKPAQDMINQIARRLEIKADMAHRAHLNVLNPHAFSKLSENDEAVAIIALKPKWADLTNNLVIYLCRLRHTSLRGGQV